MNQAADELVMSIAQPVRLRCFRVIREAKQAAANNANIRTVIEKPMIQRMRVIQISIEPTKSTGARVEDPATRR
jgi:hypothetical protein